MSGNKVVARDENIRKLPRQWCGTPTGSHASLSAEIPDIFIPPTPIDNAGVLRGRNENSGMTTGGILSHPLERRRQQKFGGGKYRELALALIFGIAFLELGREIFKIVA